VVEAFLKLQMVEVPLQAPVSQGQVQAVVEAFLQPQKVKVPLQAPGLQGKVPSQDEIEVTGSEQKRSAAEVRKGAEHYTQG
jgi:hypothetical protein